MRQTPPFRLSKKLTITILTTTLLLANNRLDLGLDYEAQALIAGVVGAYLIGQGVADMNKMRPF